MRFLSLLSSASRNAADVSLICLMELVKLSIFKYVTTPLPRDYLSLRRNAILLDAPVSFNSRKVPVFT